MIVRGEMNINNLKIMYDTINHMIKKEDCYYEKEEFEKIKENKEKILVKI